MVIDMRKSKLQTEKLLISGPCLSSLQEMTSMQVNCLKRSDSNFTKPLDNLFVTSKQVKMESLSYSVVDGEPSASQSPSTLRTDLVWSSKETNSGLSTCFHFKEQASGKLLK